MHSASEFDSNGDSKIRTRQVSSLLSRVIQDRLSRGLADPRMRGMVSVTGVEPSSDLRSAVVLISVLPGEYSKRVLMALKSAKGIFQRQIKKETSLKHVPDLMFRLDNSIKRDAEIARAVRESESSCIEDEGGLDSPSQEST